jgi:hypothetical protein
MIQVLGLVEDEKIFNNLNFFKSYIRNLLIKHLDLCVYMFGNFPYNEVMGIWQSKKHRYALNAWGTSIVTYRLANAHQVLCFFHCLQIVDLETLWFVNFLLLYVSKELKKFHGVFGLLFSWFSLVWWSKFSKFLLPRNWTCFPILF